MDVTTRLRQHGIQPSAQRIAIAECVLDTTAHPSADRVWAAARERLATLSRASVYNTLNLFVERGLLQALPLGEGAVRFDPNTHPHHHFVDEATGTVHDVDWEALRVDGVDALPGLEVEKFHVVLSGKATSRARKPR